MPFTTQLFVWASYGDFYFSNFDLLYFNKYRMDFNPVKCNTKYKALATIYWTAACETLLKVYNLSSKNMCEKLVGWKSLLLNWECIVCVEYRFSDENMYVYEGIAYELTSCNWGEPDEPHTSRSFVAGFIHKKKTMTKIGAQDNNRCHLLIIHIRYVLLIAQDNNRAARQLTTGSLIKYFINKLLQYRAATFIRTITNSLSNGL